MSEHAEQRVRAALDMWQSTFQDCDTMVVISTVRGQSILLVTDLRAVLDALDDYRNAYRQRGAVIPQPGLLGEVARRAVREWKFTRTRRGQ